MKKIKEIIKNNIKIVIAFILGGVVFGTLGVYAATTLLSQSVYYNNTNSGATSTNVQGALDELYTRASKWLNPNDMGTPQYYATTGTYKGWCSSTDTNCNSNADFPTTSTTPPSGKNVYAAKYKDGQYGVCIKRNGKEHCFRARNYKVEAKHVQEVFSDVGTYDSSTGLGCHVTSSAVSCSASDFRCRVSSDGGVYCSDGGPLEGCFVLPGGWVSCG